MGACEVNHDDISGWPDDGPGWEQLEQLLAMRWQEQFDALYGRKPQETRNVNVDDIYVSKHLKATDLNGRKVTVTIDSATVEKLGDKNKVVLYFRGKDKGFVLNVTNKEVIKAAYGSNTDNWIGKDIVLYSAKVSYNNSLVDALKAEIPVPAAAPGEEPPF